MAKSIEFTASGCSSVLGNFASGQIARNIPDALADHLVNDARCAKFIGTTVAKPAEPESVEQPKPERAKRVRKPAAAEPEFPPADPDRKGGENNPLTEADAAADLAGEPRPE